MGLWSLVSFNSGHRDYPDLFSRSRFWCLNKEIFNQPCNQLHFLNRNIVSNANNFLLYFLLILLYSNFFFWPSTNISISNPHQRIYPKVETYFTCFLSFKLMLFILMNREVRTRTNVPSKTSAVQISNSIKIWHNWTEV